jgi:hypothetical protein
MTATARKRRLRPAARGFLDSLRDFLTPGLWKQAHQARHQKKRSPRWDTQPLVLVLLLMTWCCGDSQAERFETARAFAGVCLRRRRQPGRTLAGFHKALARLPLTVLQTIADGVRHRLAALFALTSDGFAAFGCDGSRLECPRSRPLSRRLGQAARKGSAPMLRVTALVHLRTGLLWSWRVGTGKASERRHLLTLVPTLPSNALVVADAGFTGYELARSLMQKGVSFLVRLGGDVTVYTDEAPPRRGWTDGPVSLWTKEARRRRRRQPPLKLRLIRRRGKKGHDVWLLTNVLESGRLSAEQAGQYYRWRWENEGLFRTYKRTLKKVKLSSRTPRLAWREAEGSLLATQLLLAQGARGLGRGGQGKGKPQRRTERCSPRQVLRLIREAIRERRGSGGRFVRGLKRAYREQRQRQSRKVKRRWPQRSEQRKLKPPKILVMPEELKALRDKLERWAA